MADDPTTNHDSDFSPNDITQDGETAGKEWLESNVSARVDEWVGQRIGEFEIIQIIGTGGMGNVYEARQLHPHRSVALKIVKSAAASPATLQRFEMESEMLARLQHPGIAQVYDSGHQMQGDTLLPFFAMEYVPGSRSITEYAESEHLSRKGRLELLLLVCNAVQFGHGRGVIHRDLKPSNILITASGRPKVIDFGVALMAGADEVEKTITLTGRFVGTLQWASPEQCGEDPHDVDVRTDVYSLGVIMYQLMVGELPYSLKGIPLYRAPLVVREAKPIPPRTIDETIPVEIEQILAKALTKDRESRYESVAELAMDLKRFLSDQPIHAKPPTSIRRLRLYAKRNQLKFKAGIVVVLAILLGLTGLIWGLVESTKRSKEFQEMYSTAQDATDKAEQRAYTSKIATVQTAIANNSWKMAREHLASAERKYRGWEWHYLHGIVDHSIGVWPVGDRPNALVTSPDGESVAVAFEGVRIGIIDESREVLRTLQMTERVSSLAFATGGTMLVIGMADGGIALVDLVEDTLLRFDSDSTEVSSITAGNEGKFLTGHSNGLVHFWDIEGVLLRTFDSGSGTVLSLAIDFSGKYLAIGKTNGDVQIWNQEEGKMITKRSLHRDAVYDLVFLKNGNLISVGGDGVLRIFDPALQTSVESIRVSDEALFTATLVDNKIATAGKDGVIRLWDENTFALLDELRGHDDWVWSIGTIGDRRLASVSRDGNILWWSTVQPTLSAVRTTDKLPASDIAFVWNDTLAVVSEFEPDVQIINVVTRESRTKQSSHGHELTTVKHIPKTSSLVTGDVGGNVRMWDSDSGVAGDMFGKCNGQVSSLAVSASGKRVAAGTLHGEISVWAVQKKSLLLQVALSDSNVLALSFGNDGKTLFVSLSRDAVVAIDIATGNELWKQKNRADVVAMEFVHSQNALLTAEATNEIQFLEVTNGTVLLVGEASGDSLRDIALFPDEKRIATLLADGTVSIWDAETLVEIASFPSSSSADCVSVSSDGYVLSVGGGDAKIQLMDGMSRSARLTNTNNGKSD
jgi:eukaryotic-like serine/threonine-protein kinase